MGRATLSDLKKTSETGCETTDKNPPCLCLPEKASSDSTCPEHAGGFSPARRVSPGVRVVLLESPWPRAWGRLAAVVSGSPIGIVHTTEGAFPLGEQLRPWG